MADKNLEDGDIEPAPKLIQVVFQNCKGQVDQWIEPYLRITIERLQRTEKSYLKCLLMQVVRVEDLGQFTIVNKLLCNAHTSQTFSLVILLCYSYSSITFQNLLLRIFEFNCAGG